MPTPGSWGYGLADVVRPLELPVLSMQYTSHVLVNRWHFFMYFLMYMCSQNNLCRDSQADCSLLFVFSRILRSWNLRVATFYGYVTQQCIITLRVAIK